MTTQSNNTWQKPNTQILILGGALILLLIVFAVFAINSNKDRRAIEAMIEFERERLEQEYTEWYFHSELDFTVDNDSLLLLLEEERNKIRHLLERIRVLEASDVRTFNELRRDLERARQAARHFIMQVDSLNNLNQELRTENIEIRQRNLEVESDLRKLASETEQLSSRIALASILEIDDIQITGLNSRGRTTMSLARVETFQFCFQISRNRLVDTGMKNVYLRFIGPDDILFVDSENAGTFSFEGRDIPYTAKITVEYEGLDLNACIFWRTQQPLESGLYRAEIFINGFSVGEREILW